MKIHEYQAKKLFMSYGVNTTCGVTVTNYRSAADAAARLGGSTGFVVKAQIHSGGRGKAGGVKFCKTPADVADAAREILGKTLVTNQTGPEGKVVKRVLVESASEIKKEFYLSMAIDNESAGLVLIASAEGGTEIEEVAASQPDKIIKINIPYGVGIMPYHALYLAQRIGLPHELRKSLVVMVEKMYNLFIAEDCSLVEINPLIINGKNELIAIDAKINIDDNAMFRHANLLKLRDNSQENPKELEAAEHDLNYIQLDGTIGCMVNGAGLAMATMDIIQAYGGSPANFLDVGGSATTERVTAAFRILLSDPNIRCILVNIFGGIMKCDVLASGIVEATKIVKPKVPIVVRFDGTNVDQGRDILAKSGLRITTAASMQEAAQKSVHLAK